MRVISPQSPVRPRRVRRTVFVAMIGAVAVLGAACDVPVKPAGGLFDSWKGNDADGAHSFATQAAIEQIFSKTYSPKSEWFFNKCDGTAGSTYCSWINNVETTLLMRVTNSSNKVTDVQYIALASGITGRFFHEWRKNNQSAAAQYGTNTAIWQIWSTPYDPDDHWTPSGCEGAAGSIYCTWFADDGRSIVTQYDSVSSHKVIAVQHDTP